MCSCYDLQLQHIIVKIKLLQPINDVNGILFKKIVLEKYIIAVHILRQFLKVTGC